MADIMEPGYVATRDRINAFGAGGQAMCRSIITAIIVGCGLVGCVNESPTPELTPQRARDALIELIQSPDPGKLKDFPWHQFAADEVRTGTDDSVSWGPFSLLLKEREYTYSQSFGPPQRVCMWVFRGKFELKDGRWIALPNRSDVRR